MNKRALRHLRSDMVMAGVIDRIGRVKLAPLRHPPFQSLVRGIIHQQLNGRAAATILSRFEGLFEPESFPSASAVFSMETDKLLTAGLSRSKAAYIKAVAKHTLDGMLPQLEDCDCLTDAQIIEKLTVIKGIGRWTAEMLLIFNLGRPDVLPVHDFGIRKGYQIAYRKRKLPEPSHLERVGSRWAPFRTAAALYLWRMADLPKEVVS